MAQQIKQKKNRVLNNLILKNYKSQNINDNACKTSARLNDLVEKSENLKDFDPQNSKNSGFII